MKDKKPDLQKDSGEKYWQDMALILSHMKRFRKAVLKAREKWGVPPTGLPYDKRANWYGSLFLKPDVNLNDNYYSSDQNELLPPSKLIRSTLKEISKDFNLDSRWHTSLLLHIAGGDQLGTPTGSLGFNVRFNDIRLPENRWIVKRIWIDIYADTSQGDIEKIWKQIEKYQAMMALRPPKKRRPIQNAEKYAKIRDLEDKNLTQQEIADKYKKFGFTTAIDVANFKKEMEKRFSPLKIVR